MSIATYTELQASVANWMNRTDLGPVIPDFIAIAESRIQTDLRLRDQITAGTLSTVAGTQTVVLPTDFLEFVSLVVGDDPLEYMTPDRLREAADWSRTTPIRYSLEGASILLSPTPSTVYSIPITYYAKVPSLASNSTNWLLTKYPNIYLYGSLVSGHQFVKDFDGANYWGTLYSQACQVAKGADMRSSSGSPLTIRTRR